MSELHCRPRVEQLEEKVVPSFGLAPPSASPPANFVGPIQVRTPVDLGLFVSGDPSELDPYIQVANDQIAADDARYAYFPTNLRTIECNGEQGRVGRLNCSDDLRADVTELYLSLLGESARLHADQDAARTARDRAARAGQRDAYYQASFDYEELSGRVQIVDDNIRDLANDLSIPDERTFEAAVIGTEVQWFYEYRTWRDVTDQSERRLALDRGTGINKATVFRHTQEHYNNLGHADQQLTDWMALFLTTYND